MDWLHRMVDIGLSRSFFVFQRKKTRMRIPREVTKLYMSMWKSQSICFNILEELRLGSAKKHVQKQEQPVIHR